MYLKNGTFLQGERYKIVRHINSGGFGNTYEGIHVMLDKRVAIKEFFVKDFCNRDEATSQVITGITAKTALVSKLRKKFIDEARSLCKLEHPNIVHVYDVFEENGTAYYVMDYIDGKSVHEILKTQNSLPESQAVKYICQVAHALQYVHEKNRLHLDIKPGNIMIDANDNAVLIDFGASKQYDEEAGENTSTLLGKTPGYAPIEQMGNNVQTFTPATDIYALGATLYKMLSGITPPESTILVSDDDALKPLPSHITVATRKAVECAMRVKRSERPQNVSTWLNILNDTATKPESVTPKRPTPVVDDEQTIIEEPVQRRTRVIPQTKNEEPVTRTAHATAQIKNEPKQTVHRSQPEKKESSNGCIWGVVIFLILIFVIGLSIGNTGSNPSNIEKNESNNTSSTQVESAWTEVTYKEITNSKGQRFRYTGKLYNGVPNGEGKGVYDSGTYEGGYTDGLREGNGEFHHKAGDVFKGTFKDDAYDWGTVTLSDGSSFSGSFSNGQPYDGTWYDKNENRICYVRNGVEQ